MSEQNPYLNIGGNSPENPYMIEQPDSSEGLLQKALSTVGQIGRNVDIGTNRMVNTATFGATDALGGLLEKILPTPEGMYNPTIATPESSPGQGINGFIHMISHPMEHQENLAEGIGNTAGFIGGGPGKIFSGIEKAGIKYLPKLLEIGKTVGRSAGGVASGFSAPGSLEERSSNAKLGGILGPVLGKVGDVGVGTVQGIGKFFNKLTGKNIRAVNADIQRTQGDILSEKAITEEVGGKAKRFEDTSKKWGAREKSQAEISGREDAAMAERGIQARVSDMFKQAREKWTNMRNSLSTKGVNEKDMIDVLDAVIAEKGIQPGTQYQSPAEANLLNLRSRYSSQLPKETPTGEYDLMALIRDPNAGPIMKPAAAPAKISDAGAIKRFSDEVWDAMGGRSDLEGAFLKHLDAKLQSKGITEFQDANLDYQNAYSAKRVSKKSGDLSESAYKRAAKGTLPSSDEVAMLGAEKKTGVSYLKDIINKQRERSGRYAETKSTLAKRSELLRRIEEASKGRTGLMEDAMKGLETKIKWEIAKTAGAAGVAAIPLMSILSKMFGSGAGETVKKVVQSAT